MPWWFWCLVIPGGLFLYLSIGCVLFIITSKLVDEDWRSAFRYQSGFVTAFFFLWPLLEPVLLIAALGDITAHILNEISRIGEDKK